MKDRVNEDDPAPSLTEVKSGTCPPYRPGVECDYEGDENNYAAYWYNIFKDTSDIDWGTISFSTIAYDDDNYDGRIYIDDWK